MRRTRSSLACLVAGLAIAWSPAPPVLAAAAPPPTASPGDPEVFAEVSGPCPTFSWGTVAGAEQFELVLYTVDAEGVAATEPWLHQRLPGTVTAWTPPLGSCPTHGRRYAWTVRASVGGTPTEWSESRLFALSELPPIERVEEALEVLRRYARGDAPVNEPPGDSGAAVEGAGDRPSAVGTLPPDAGSGETGAARRAREPERAPPRPVESEPALAPGGPSAAPLTTGPSLVLGTGGIRFPDGSLQVLPSWDASGPLENSLRVSGSTLKPRDNDVSYATNVDGSCVYITAGDPFTVWNTPVHLPDGATVAMLRMFYLDSIQGATSGWFTVYDLYGNIVDEWGVSSLGTAGYGFNDSAAIGHVITNSAYSYALNWRPNSISSGLQLCGLRLFYGG